MSPDQCNVCFLEPIVPGDATSYEIGFSAIQCEERNGPDQPTLSWVKQVFAGKDTVSTAEAWAFVKKHLIDD